MWEPQKECRYRFFVFPMKDVAASIQNVERLYDDMKLGVELPFTHYDLRLQDVAFAEMEILPGYDCTKEEIDKICDLVKDYNKTATIVKNEFAGQIKNK